MKLKVLAMTMMCTAVMAIPSLAGSITIEGTDYTVERIVTEEGTHAELLMDSKTKTKTQATSLTSISEKLGPLLGTFKLTSYCTGHCCNGKWGNVTEMGGKIIPGQTIAVDKSVIPLNTWVYINIPGQGWQKFRAEDTGSGVNGRHIDVAVQNHEDTFVPEYNGYAEVRLALD